MSGYTDGTDTYTYKYDANNIRTQKNDKQYIIDINNNVVQNFCMPEMELLRTIIIKSPIGTL